MERLVCCNCLGFVPCLVVESLRSAYRFGLFPFIPSLGLGDFAFELLLGQSRGFALGGEVGAALAVGRVRIAPVAVGANIIELGSLVGGHRGFGIDQVQVG